MSGKYNQKNFNFGGYGGNHGYGGYGNGSYGRRGQGSSYGRTPQKPYVPPKKVAHAALIIHDKNDPDFEEIRLMADYQFQRAISVGNFDEWKVTLAEGEEKWKYPSGKDHVPAICIDKEDIPYRVTKSRSVALCAFNATSEFMTHQLGKKLDNHDRRWYTLNSLNSTHGLPQQNTFTVLQQLVEPYGIGISNIIVPRNFRRFKEYHPFISSLGCNPFFLVDGSTTNEEALEKMFPDEAVRNEMRPKLLPAWRYECRDEPETGTISMRQFSDGPGHNGGSNYFGPRAPLGAEGWRVSLKMDFLRNIKYQVPLNLPKYTEYEGSKTEDIWQIKDADGKTLSFLKQQAWKLSKKKADEADKKFSAAKPQLPALPPKLPPAGPRSRHEIPQQKLDDSWFKEFDGLGGKDLSSGDTPLPRELISEDPEEDTRVLAYQSICEECQRDIGNHYVNNERACVWCGTYAEIALIEPEELGFGYIIIPDEDLETEEDDVDMSEEHLPPPI